MVAPQAQHPRFDPDEDEEGEEVAVVSQPRSAKIPSKRRWMMRPWILAPLISFLVLFIIALVLAMTVFKIRQPKIRLLSAAVDGVAPRITFPAVHIHLNLTLNVLVLVENRNYASFRHGPGRSELLYRGVQVGEAEVGAGRVPARGSVTLGFPLKLMADRLQASDISSVLRDVMGGELGVESKSRLPGRITVLRIYKKHVVTISDCQFRVGFPDMDIRRQDCHFHSKF